MGRETTLPVLAGGKGDDSTCSGGWEGGPPYLFRRVGRGTTLPVLVGGKGDHPTCPGGWEGGATLPVMEAVSVVGELDTQRDDDDDQRQAPAHQRVLDAHVAGVE